MIQSIERAVRVLEVLVERSPHAILGDIARDASLPSATVYRILQTLVQLGYATSLDNGYYKAGPKVLVLAGAMLASMDYTIHARPALMQLQEVTQETIHFGVLSGEKAQYVDKLEGHRPYRLASVVGMTLDLHCTAIGKAILSWMPRKRVDEIVIPERLTAHTPKTITKVDTLMEELERIRTLGYSIDDEEDREGVRCVGAPVFDHLGEVIGGISISGPTFYLSVQDAIALSPAVMEAARAISGSLGAPRENGVVSAGEVEG